MNRSAQFEIPPVNISGGGLPAPVLQGPDSALDRMQYRILKRISPEEPGYMSGEVYKEKIKIKVLLGDHVFDQLRGKVVIDFGCGEGDDAIALAKNCACRVIGMDIREAVLERARAKARQEGVENVCQFCTNTEERADAVVSIDSFEHFRDPSAALTKMYELLRPGARYSQASAQPGITRSEGTCSPSFLGHI
jgi:2-polyprenyl-3-methyl-5-hydroxy-6-metoxy-1,4-benzoquinol methylase